MVGKETKTGFQESREGTNNANQTHLCQESATYQTTEGDTSTHTATVETAQACKKVVALQTVPLILKKGNTRILVNCFLDEGSDTTYINEDLVEELGVRGQRELFTVNAANDQQVTFMSMTIRIGEYQWQSESNHFSEDVSEDLRRNESHQLAENKTQLVTPY